MEKKERIIDVAIDSSAPEHLCLESLSKGSHNDEMGHDQLSEECSSINIQSIAGEVERITQKEKSVEELKYEAEETVKWWWRKCDQDEGFVKCEENETDEEVLLSCVSDVEAPNADDESESTASASTNDSTTCVYSFSKGKSLKEGKKARRYCLLSKNRSLAAQVVDSVNLLNMVFDEDWKPPGEKKRKREKKTIFEEERCNSSRGRGRGRGRVTGIARCVAPSTRESQEPGTSQQYNGDDGEVGSDDGFY